MSFVWGFFTLIFNNSHEFVKNSKFKNAPNNKFSITNIQIIIKVSLYNC